MIRAALEARDVESTFQEEASVYVEGGIHRRDKEVCECRGIWVISGSAAWLKCWEYREGMQVKWWAGTFQDGLDLALLVIGTKESAK